MSKSKGYAAMTAKAALAPYSFERREPREHDVVIEIKYCGICHSDIHQTRDEWSDYQEESIFPMVPGHEIAGVVSAVGSKLRNTRWATKSASAASWTPAAPAPSVNEGLSSTAAYKPSGPTTDATRKARRPMAVTPTESWWMRIMCCACPRICRSMPARLCYAPESRSILRCGIGQRAPARTWPSSASEASDTWA